MNVFSEYLQLVKMQVLSMRTEVFFISLVNVAFIVGFVFGFDFLIGGIDDTTARYLTVGAATNAIVQVGLVMTPQFLAWAKQEGRLDYFRSLPIRRETYLLAQITVVAVLSAPAIVLALVAGAWHYDFSFDFHPALALVLPLSVMSVAGFGVAIAILSPRLQLTNSLTQLAIFYFIFFAPVLAPRDNLPTALRWFAETLPPTHAADAMRATLTDLPDTHLWRSVIILIGFAAASIVAASASMRRRG